MRVWAKVGMGDITGIEELQPYLYIVLNFFLIFKEKVFEFLWNLKCIKN